MALSAIGRKALLPHGAQRKIARRLGMEEARVSTVNAPAPGDLPKTELGWQSWRRAQKAIAKVLGMTVEEAFQDWERGEVQLEEMSA